MRLLECSPCRLALLGLVGGACGVGSLAVAESSADFLVRGKLWIGSWRRSRPSGRSRLGLRCRTRRESGLLLLAVLSVVHILPSFESILAFGGRISALSGRCLSREVREAISSGLRLSLICARLGTPRRWRVCRCCLVWVASGASSTACTAAEPARGEQASLSTIAIVSALLPGLA